MILSYPARESVNSGIFPSIAGTTVIGNKKKRLNQERNNIPVKGILGITNYK